MAIINPPYAQGNADPFGIERRLMFSFAAH
jgi:hypothetical protein